MEWNITCGVPQGSVLGPLLFLLYINDLRNISKVLDFYLFADDTNIYYESNSIQDLEKTINKELNKLYLWLNVNRLSLNIDKTNYIIFHPYNNPMKQHITIKINNKAINEKEFIKYLGVFIDSTLSWKHQISNISKKISQAIGIMYKLRPFLPLKVMKNVYYSLIYSHIIYAIEAWGSPCKTELDKIFILQKWAMRLMTYNDKYPTFYGSLISSDPIFIELEMLKVSDIQISSVKCINKTAPINVHNSHINHKRHGYSTRLNNNINAGIKINNLFIPSVRTTNYSLKQLKSSGPRIWNVLPTMIKNTTSLYIFLKKLKLYSSQYG